MCICIPMRALCHRTWYSIRRAPVLPHDHVIAPKPSMLQVVRETLPGIETACFTPIGQSPIAQGLTVLRGGILNDVDTCLREGSDWVFVPPWALSGDVVGHIKGLHRGLGVFGADTQDGFNQVQSWRHRVDVVYADHPTMYHH